MTITLTSSKQFIEQFQTRAVRDLAWSCFSPNIIDQFQHSTGVIPSCGIGLNEKRHQWLLKLDQHPQPLLDKIATLKSKRLGIYHEALWHFFLSNDEDISLIGNNIKVFRDKRTLGELDVIYFCKQRKQYYHLELAIKFYLNHQSVNSIPLSRWLGPNCNDRLDIKVARLLDHQIQLSKTPQGISVLQQAGVDEVSPEISLKGYLFNNNGSQTGDKRLSKNHCSEQWRHISQFIAESHTNIYWCHLQKPHWTSPIFTAGNTDSIMHIDKMTSYLENYFLNYQRPLMLCALNKSIDAKGDTIYSEKQRFMITPDIWPFST